jgi:hypothetical protein
MHTTSPSLTLFALRLSVEGLEGERLVASKIHDVADDDAPGFAEDPRQLLIYAIPLIKVWRKGGWGDERA